MEFKRQKYMDALVERMHNGMIKVVTGIRRSGKSYLLFNLFARYLMQQGWIISSPCSSTDGICGATEIPTCSSLGFTSA